MMYLIVHELGEILVALLIPTVPLQGHNQGLDGEERADCFALSSWCLVIVVWLFLTIPQVCLQFVIVVFPDYTQYFLVHYSRTMIYQKGFLPDSIHLWNNLPQSANDYTGKLQVPSAVCPLPHL